MQLIKFKETEDQIELIKAMASRNKVEAMEARQAFAALIMEPARKVLSQLGTAPMIYQDLPFGEDEDPSIPLDLYLDVPVGHINVWSQQLAGGLPTNQVAGMQEMKISTYRLDSAVSLNRKYARRARLDVVAAAISRMLQEVLVKQERNAWAVILKALGQASTNGADHLLTSTTQDTFQLDDFNRLITLVDRINESFAQGTPSDFDSAGLTDIFLSPEMMEQVRAFAYQPMNTRGVPNSDESTAVPLPDSIRERVFNNVGMPEIYNKTLHKLNELGTSRKYNILFQEFAPVSVAHGGGNFDQTDEIVIGVDLTRNAFHRPIMRDGDNGGTFIIEDDDQWVKRSDKIGWYGFLEEGRICIDARAIVGLIV